MKVLPTKAEILAMEKRMLGSIEAFREEIEWAKHEITKFAAMLYRIDEVMTEKCSRHYVKECLNKHTIKITLVINVAKQIFT